LLPREVIMYRHRYLEIRGAICQTTLSIYRKIKYNIYYVVLINLTLITDWIILIFITPLDFIPIRTVNLSAVGLTTHLAFHPSPFPKVDDPSEACTFHLSVDEEQTLD
jgi:hypothetical protein